MWKSATGGAIVELLPPDGLEVEFLQRDGRTRCVATLAAADVFELNRERTTVASENHYPRAESKR